MLGLLVYPLSALAGLLVSAWAWERAELSSTRPASGQKHTIFLGCLLGMLLGAKLAYFIAEGWIDLLRSELPRSQRLLLLLQGKSVTGALLGGYIGVEAAKRAVGWHAATGDAFALMAPFSLGLGRIGCWLEGCCLGVPLREAPYTMRDAHGVPRWPAAPLELAFNLVLFALALAVMWRRRRGRGDALRGQLFHLYLVAYGAFRFGHEFLRDTPRLSAGLSGYHGFALALLVLGSVRFWQRASEPVPSGLPQSAS